MRVLLVFGLSLAFAHVSFCYGTDKTVQVFGMGECADCAQTNIKSSEALSGLEVTIDCKTANGILQTRGVGELKEDGNFIVSLPNDIVQNGKLKEDCFAQLHSASSAACPAKDGSLEASKIVLKSTDTDGKQIFGVAGKLKFSPATCTSPSLWPHFKYPPLHKIPPWKKKHPIPFHPKYKKPFPKIPMYKKPEPEKPEPKPKPEPEKPEPKPKPEPEKPKPKPEPKKPKPKPESKPKPKFKKPDPEYKPKPKLKPYPKKPCPPFPKIPIYKFPPKHLPHPKFGHFPPLPPHYSHP